MKINNHIWILAAVLLAVLIIPNTSAMRWGQTNGYTYDDFEDASINLTLWNYTFTNGFGSATEAGGRLKIEQAQPSGQPTKYGHVDLISLELPLDLEFYDNITIDVALSAGQVGNFQTTTGCLFALNETEPIYCVYGTVASSTYDLSNWTIEKDLTQSGNIFKVYDDGVYNKTITAVNTNITGYAYAYNDLSGTMISSVDFINIDYSLGEPLANVTEINQTFDTTPLELSNTNFTLNLQLNNESITNLNATFVYNNSVYSITSLTNSSWQNWTFFKTFDLPSNIGIIDNNEFYWNVSYTLDGANYSGIPYYVYNQSVGKVSLELCNATFKYPFINFTIIDEISKVNLSGSNFAGTFFIWWLDDLDNNRTISFDIANDADGHFDFCSSIDWIDLNVDLISEYSKTGYVTRTYYLDDAILNNNTNFVDLSLLNESDGITFYFTAYRGADSLSNAIMSITRYFPGEGVYREIGRRKTDADGRFIELLELNKDYRIIASIDGETVGSLDINSYCSSSPCEISLQYNPEGVEYWDSFYNFYDLNVGYTWGWDEDTGIVSFTYNDPAGTANYVRLKTWLVKYNETSSILCDTNSTSASGTLICNVSAYQPAEFTSKAYISRSPEKLIDVFTSLSRGLKGALNNFGSGFGILIALILIVTSALATAWNPVVGISVAVIAFWLSTFMGFLNIGFTVIVALTVIAVILITKMRN